MNVNDFVLPAVRPKTWPLILPLIFQRQAQLMEQYQAIEGLPKSPLSVHHAVSQKVLKDFAWRTTEELAESYEAWEKHPDNFEVAEQHALEELADAWHFFVELLIFAGITAEQCLAVQNRIVIPIRNRVASSDAYWYVVYKLGIAMNFLRNKAWKQSQVPTDEKRFREALLDTYKTMCMLWSDLGYGEDQIYSYYFRKAEVNAFRQRSKY
jgi:hypothetical protein